MAQSLSTILNDAGGRALVEKYLDKKFLERRNWNGVLANSKFLTDRGIPKNEGQYVQFTRLGRFRRPQTMALSTATNEYADPSSGALMSTSVVTVPVEFIQEYIDIPTVSAMTSWIDLERWAEEDMPMALKRRMHELVQNAFVVGRMTPGLWSSTSSVATTAFDASAEATVSIHGVSFTFKSAPKYYANNKATFADMTSNDKITWNDMRRVSTAIKLAGGMDVTAFISESVKNELMFDGKDGEFFSFAIRNNTVGNKALGSATEVDYSGIHLVVDDQPYTENFGAEGVRATNGPIHSILFTAKDAVGYINLGNKRASWKPSFHIQDVSKTGVVKTIGYLVPFQAAVLDDTWCAVLKTPVSQWLPNGTELP